MVVNPQTEIQGQFDPEGFFLYYYPWIFALLAEHIDNARELRFPPGERVFDPPYPTGLVRIQPVFRVKLTPDFG